MSMLNLDKCTRTILFSPFTDVIFPYVGPCKAKSKSMKSGNNSSILTNSCIPLKDSGRVTFDLSSNKSRLSRRRFLGNQVSTFTLYPGSAESIFLNSWFFYLYLRFRLLCPVNWQKTQLLSQSKVSVVK